MDRRAIVIVDGKLRELPAGDTLFGGGIADFASMWEEYAGGLRDAGTGSAGLWEVDESDNMTPSNGSDNDGYWELDEDGNVTPRTAGVWSSSFTWDVDNNYNVGEDGSGRPAWGYFATGVGIGTLYLTQNAGNLDVTGGGVNIPSGKTYNINGSPHNHDASYEPIGATATHAALTSTAHGLGASAFHADSYFDLAGTGHTEAAAHVTSHESLYTHANIANGQTAFGWGNHAGLYDAAGTGHTEASSHVSTHESAYDHTDIAHGETAYGWGNHASAGYSLTSHNHDAAYAALSHAHTGVYSPVSHVHTGVYDPAGTGHTEAATHVSAHESTYSHANYNTAYGWGNHASAGYSLTSHNHDAAYAALSHAHTGVYSPVSHVHTGVYDPAGTGHTEAAAHVSTHESSYDHTKLHAAATAGTGISITDQIITNTDRGAPAVISHQLTFDHANIANGQTAYGWGNHASAGYLAQSGTALPSSYLSSSLTSLGTISSLIATTIKIINSSFPTKLNLWNSFSNSSNRNWSLEVTNAYYGDLGIYCSAVADGTPVNNVMHFFSNGSVAIPFGGLHVGGDSYSVGDNNLLVDGDCSALTFTDRTPAFKGDALEAIKKISDDGNGSIDHDTLPEFARSTYKAKTGKKIKTKHSKGEVDEYADAPGRDIGAMLSIITVGIQQLLGRVEALEKKEVNNGNS